MTLNDYLTSPKMQQALQFGGLAAGLAVNPLGTLTQELAPSVLSSAGNMQLPVTSQELQGLQHILTDPKALATLMLANPTITGSELLSSNPYSQNIYNSIGNDINNLPLFKDINSPTIQATNQLLATLVAIRDAQIRQSQTKYAGMQFNPEYALNNYALLPGFIQNQLAGLSKLSNSTLSPAGGIATANLAATLRITPKTFSQPPSSSDIRLQPNVSNLDLTKTFSLSPASASGTALLNTQLLGSQSMTAAHPSMQLPTALFSLLQPYITPTTINTATSDINSFLNNIRQTVYSWANTPYNPNQPLSAPYLKNALGNILSTAENFPMDRCL